jgi:hypothetical protein
MNYHFSIILQEDKVSAMQKIIAEAEKSEFIAIGKNRAPGHTIVFCPTIETAEREQNFLDEGTEISPHLCVGYLKNCSISFSLECSDASQVHLAQFVKWIIRETPIKEITDDDTHQDITELALRNPDALFKTDNMS